MVTIRSILSSPNRLFFLVTLVVFFFVVYLLHSMGDGNAVKMHFMPNYDKTFELPDNNNPALPFLTKQISSDVQSPKHSKVSRLHHTSSPNEGSIFYIDPPDKPIKPVPPKRSLVDKRLQNGVVKDPGFEFLDDELYDNHNNEILLNNPADDIKIGNDSPQANKPDSGNIRYDKDLTRPKVGESNGKKTELAGLKQELQRMKTDQDSLVQEWQKLREEQHKLLEDKIRFKKELSVGHWHTHDPMELLYRRRLPPTDSLHWEGLNSSEVELRYPGILFSREYKIQPFINLADKFAAGMESRPLNINNMSDGQAENRFYQLLTQTHLDCGDIKRLGNTGDGGWDICVVDPYFPKPGCIIYSFGINYDFTFDDAIAETFGCEVRTFDPSMMIGDHMHQPTVYFYQLGLGAANTVNDKGWKLETMGSIMMKLGHLNKTIDILKLDIEFGEWACFRTMLKEGVLRNIKQLVMEIHTPEVYAVGRPSSKHDFYMMYSVLHGLERQGFRKFHFTYNPLGKYQSVRTGKSRSCCYELYYVNIKFLGT